MVMKTSRMAILADVKVRTSSALQRPELITQVTSHSWRISVVFCIMTFVWIVTHQEYLSQPTVRSSLAGCAWKKLEPHVSELTVEPIQRKEYLSRQARLARVLEDEDVDAFVAEASASSEYHANISSTLDKSERPFLMIISKDGSFTYLVPNFEADRISRLPMVYRNVSVIKWAEEESPYQVFARKTGFKKIMLDEQARFMIATGLRHAGIEVVPMSKDARLLREIKSRAEIRILKAINLFTVQAIRALQTCVRLGLTQTEVTEALELLFQRAGVGQGFWALVLFGEQAAYPHGGQPNKVLSDSEFILIDVGSKLHGYGSDVTRTILPNAATCSKDLWNFWYTVHDAQTAAIRNMNANETCASVDEASRRVIREAGFAEFYTHRLGHGLGLEMHEHPFLNGANQEKLQIGEVVTNEPVCFFANHISYSLTQSCSIGHICERRPSERLGQKAWLRSSD